MKKCSYFLAIVIIFLTLTTNAIFANESSSAEKVPSAKEIWNRIMTSNPGMKDFVADMKIKAGGRWSIIPLHQTLEGVYYFKKPDKHKLKLTKSSYLLKKFPNILNWNLPSLAKNRAKVTIKESDGRKFYVIYLTPTTLTKNLKSEELWVDAENYTYPLHIYDYKNGGKIVIRATYQKEGGYMVLERLNGTFTFPKDNLTATADTQYTNYRFNQGLSDDLFKKND